MISTFQHWQDLSTLRPGPSVGNACCGAIHLQQLWQCANPMPSLNHWPKHWTFRWCHNETVPVPTLTGLWTWLVQRSAAKDFTYYAELCFPYLHNSAKEEYTASKLGRGLICLFWWPRVATRYLQDGLLKLWVPLLTTGFPNKNEQLRIILGYSGVPQWLSKPSYCPNMYVYELFTHLLYI